MQTTNMIIQFVHSWSGEVCIMALVCCIRNILCCVGSLACSAILRFILLWFSNTLAGHLDDVASFPFKVWAKVIIFSLHTFFIVGQSLDLQLQLSTFFMEHSFSMEIFYHFDAYAYNVLYFFCKNIFFTHWAPTHTTLLHSYVFFVSVVPSVSVNGNTKQPVFSCKLTLEQKF